MGVFRRIVEDRYHNLHSVYEANLGKIPGKTEASNLVYDSETKVIYYKFFDRPRSAYADNTMVGYLAPYISENGKYCRFIDNQIVEIN